MVQLELYTVDLIIDYEIIVFKSMLFYTMDSKQYIKVPNTVTMI